MGKNFGVLETDVLVVGGGGAGLRAAIEAHDCGAKVIVLSKSLKGKAHTVMAEGGLAAALGNLDPKDNWKEHFKDTFVDGQKIANPKMVEILCREAPQMVLELEKWGAVFDRSNDGKIMQRPFGAHSFRRVCHVGDRTGLEIIQTLLSQAKKRKILFFEETVATNIFASENKVVGATVLKLQEGSFFFIRAKAIVLATGGLCRAYLTTSNSFETTGDGFALAFNAGAQLMDMEMVQFHPTGMVFPESAKGILVTESVRGEGGILLNSKGARFMENYDKKRMELSARDVVAKAIFNEVKNGRGTVHGGVYMDISFKPKEFVLKKLPKMAKQFMDFAGIDITSQKMEVSTTAHYVMGGVMVDAQTCSTSVSGLFACGEVACGVHGANRLGGNSLADILVFGKRAGWFAAALCKEKNPGIFDESTVEKEFERIMKPFNAKKGENAGALKKRIQQTMWLKAGVERDAKGLRMALKELQKIKKQAAGIKLVGGMVYNVEWLAWLDVQNMLVTCTSIIKSALMRKESRGAHMRADFPKQDDKKWLANIICKKDGNKMKLFKKKAVGIPKELQGILNEKSKV